jgi:ribosome-associated toxin RatA of RatAB toxin-antitoxin module
MTLVFSLLLPSPNYKIYEKMTDFENLKDYLPMQIESVKILKKPEQSNLQKNQIITEENIVSNSILKASFIQQSLHTLKENELHTQIIEGPGKGTLIKILFENKEEQTLISIQIDLKLKLKYIFLSPIIKKEYKKMLTSILYRINTGVQSELE